MHRLSVHDEIRASIHAVVEGEGDCIARMATVAAVLMAQLGDISWCGFYRVDLVDPRMLVVGPYQGPLGCLRIPFDRGVCGAAASSREVVIVADVHTFPGHIACDTGAVSEIVVPVFDNQGELIAVLDVDSHSKARFDSVDAASLRRLMDEVFAG